MRQTLEANDLRVCGEGTGGRDGIEKAQQLHPDLIVLDLSMPDMDGLRAARLLKSLMPTIPLVLYTMFGDDTSVRHEAWMAGMADVVSKSDSPAKLVKIVRTALQ
jgi:DNA-binding NarL/FixJ family response regulator